MNRNNRNKRKIEFNESKLKEFNEMSSEELSSLLAIINNNQRINELYSKNYIPFFYNDCYGGSGPLPPFALHLIKKYGEDVDELFLAKVIFYYSDNISWEYSNMNFVMVKRELYQFMTVNEYDGLETPKFNISEYRSFKLKEMLESEYESVDDMKNKLREVLTLKINDAFIKF